MRETCVIIGLFGVEIPRTMSPRNDRTSAVWRNRQITHASVGLDWSFFDCFRFHTTISNKPEQTVWIFHLTKNYAIWVINMEHKLRIYYFL